MKRPYYPPKPPKKDGYGPYDYISPLPFIHPFSSGKEIKLTKEVTMKMSMAIPKEIEEHLAVCDWLNKNGVYFIHIPNEGKRSVQQAVLLKRMGLQKGAPDFIIPGPENIALELKRCKVMGKSGKMITPSNVSTEQKACLAMFGKLGWTTYVAYGAADAIGFLQGRDLVRVPIKKVSATMMWGGKKIKVETPFIARGKAHNTKLIKVNEWNEEVGGE